MAKPKTMETRKLVSFPAGLARAVEDFRYANRIPSSSEAIRRLVEAGLDVCGIASSSGSNLAQIKAVREQIRVLREQGVR